MLMRSWCALSFCAVAIGCGGGGDSLTAPNSTVATVTISPSSQTITVGQTLQLTADVRDAQGRAVSGQTVSWTSSAPSIVSVSTTGLATAQNEGPATIAATVGGKTGQTVLTGSYPYPNVAGTWNITGTFDELPTASITGTFALTQQSRFSGSITGVANLITVMGGQVFPVPNYPIAATVTSTGVLSFTLTEATAATWSFVGTIAGNTVSDGRHTLSDGITPHSGSWRATRAGTVAPRIAGNAPAAADLQNMLRALR